MRNAQAMSLCGLGSLCALGHSQLGVAAPARTIDPALLQTDRPEPLTDTELMS